MKMRRFAAAILSVLMFSACVTGCGSTEETPAATDGTASTESTSDTNAGGEDDGKLKVGFAQIGQESGWRDAETASIQFYAGQNLDTIDFKFADAQQKQENQIKAIKSFIDMGVDVIGLAPVVETGWDAVFTEAKDAGIPIILVDRMADVPEDLYATFIGSDFIEEGKNAADEMAKLIGNSGKIVQLEGTVGASSANDRKKGFEDQMAAEYPDIEIIASQTGDFTRAKGKEVMESFLKPGEDIKTVSCDGVKAIFEAMVAGEANVTVECNPLLGPVFFETAQKLANGETVEKWIKSEEGIFRQETAAEDIKTRVY